MRESDEGLLVIAGGASALAVFLFHDGSAMSPVIILGLRILATDIVLKKNE